MEGYFILTEVDRESFLCKSTGTDGLLVLPVEVVALVENWVTLQVGAKFHDLQSVDLRSLDAWKHIPPVSIDEISLINIALG